MGERRGAGCHTGMAQGLAGAGTAEVGRREEEEGTGLGAAPAWAHSLPEVRGAEDQR